MKKYFILTLSLLLAQIARADDTFSAGDFKYKITSYEKREVSLIYADPEISGAITIPSEVYNGLFTYSVTSIGSNAFSHSCENITWLLYPAPSPRD